MLAVNKQLQHFIKDTSWIFAITYADTWQHWYIVQEEVDDKIFE